jgi:hypothetical protein
MRYYHQFQIQNFLANLSPTNFQIPHLFSDLFRTGTGFTSMGLSFPFFLACNWSSLWAYNTAISKTLFFLQFQHSLAKQIVSFPVHYIFKTMHSNNPSHFIYSRVQGKRKYHYLRMHPFNTLILEKDFRFQEKPLVLVAGYHGGMFDHNTRRVLISFRIVFLTIDLCFRKVTSK